MTERPWIRKLLCISLVAAVMLPVGRLLFPYVSGELSRMEFQTLEAVVSASLGFGIYGLFH